MRFSFFRKGIHPERRIKNASGQETTQPLASGFDFTEEEWATIRNWQKTHKCKYRRPDGSQYFGCCGGGYDYCFAPTGIGMFAEVRCACGAKIDVDNV